MSTFDPQNHLERALMRAAKDPAARPQFYQALIESDVYVVQADAEDAGERHDDGRTLRIAPVEIDGRQYLPIFSSLPRLQAVVTHEVSYAALNALEFLKITRGAELALNPGSEYGKFFTAAEIASLLDGSGGGERWTAARDTKVMIGQPRNYPQELADALARFFERRREVSRAWIAHFFNPARDERPHTLVAVEADAEDWDRLAQDIGVVADGVTIPEPPLDIMRITTGEGVDDYFLRGSEPFFTRKER